jgi:hypothetical protein
MKGRKHAMADCEEIVVWNVPANSKLCAQSSAQTSSDAGSIRKGTSTADYVCTIKIAPGLGGPTVTWDNSDLDPDPKCLPLEDQGYAATATIAPGPSSPTVTLHAWIEAPGGLKPFDCTWTNATPRVVITIF